MEIIYTICFITRKTNNKAEVLMLFRKKDPNRGNGMALEGKSRKVRRSVNRWNGKFLKKLV